MPRDPLSVNADSAANSGPVDYPKIAVMGTGASVAASGVGSRKTSDPNCAVFIRRVALWFGSWLDSNPGNPPRSASDGRSPRSRASVDYYLWQNAPCYHLLKSLVHMGDCFQRCRLYIIGIDDTVGHYLVHVPSTAPTARWERPT